MVAATGTAQVGTKPANAAPAQAPIQPRRFRSGVQSHYEQFAQTPAMTPSAAATTPFTFDVPAYGYARRIWIGLTISGGVGSGTAAVYKEDAPFSWYQNLQVQDVNGAQIIAPLDGFDLYLINKYGGYLFAADAKYQPGYNQGGIGGNSVFWLFFPFEIRSRDALGSLPNKNAATNYKVSGTLAATTNVFATAPAPTLPTSAVVRFMLQAWWDPQETDLAGRPQAQTPPANNTLQMWSKQNSTHNSGAVTHRLTQTGYFDRNIIFIDRNATPARADNAFPSPAVLVYEGATWTTIPQDLWKVNLAQDYGYFAASEAANGLDNGVFVLNLMHDFGLQPGDEMGMAWLPTTSATRFELQGNSTAAGTLAILTNYVNARDDLAIAGG